MSKSLFDVPLQLTRAALLRLVKGETVEARANPPGATMVEAVAKVTLHQEVKEPERRAIADAITRDVPQQYQSGFSTSSWGDTAPVVGTTEWLAMIASNADRIAVQIQTGPNTWEKKYLVDCTQEQQTSAMKSWLESGQTPTWEQHRAQPAAHSLPDLPAVGSSVGGSANKSRSINAVLHHAKAWAAYEDLHPAVRAPGAPAFDRKHAAHLAMELEKAVHAWRQDGMPSATLADDFVQRATSPLPPLNVASAEDLDAWGKFAKLERWANGNNEGGKESDVSFRERIRSRVLATAPSLAHKEPPPVPAGAFVPPGTIGMPDWIKTAMEKGTGPTPSGPPVPVIPPFKAPHKTPTEEARSKLAMIRWLVEESGKVDRSAAWTLRASERDFLKSCDATLDAGHSLSDKQKQWLNDIESAGRRKAATISHLLPPTPVF